MTGEYSIEKLQGADIPRALELLCAFKQESQALSPEYDELRVDYREVLESYLKGFCERDDRMALVATDPGGDMVGIICAAIWEYIPIYRISHMGYIPELYVSPAHRNRGIGKALIREAEEWFRARGMKHARIETICAYPHNRGMYERCGYELFLIDLRKRLPSSFQPAHSSTEGAPAERPGS